MFINNNRSGKEELSVDVLVVPDIATYPLLYPIWNTLRVLNLPTQFLLIKDLRCHCSLVSTVDCSLLSDDRRPFRFISLTSLWIVPSQMTLQATNRFQNYFWAQWERAAVLLSCVFVWHARPALERIVQLQTMQFHRSPQLSTSTSGKSHKMKLWEVTDQLNLRWDIGSS